MLDFDRIKPFDYYVAGPCRDFLIASFFVYWALLATIESRILGKVFVGLNKSNEIDNELEDAYVDEDILDE